jgi:YVTN family beta-propeller protein
MTKLLRILTLGLCLGSLGPVQALSIRSALNLRDSTVTECRPQCLAFDPTRSLLYTGGEGRSQIFVVTPESLIVLARIPAPGTVSALRYNAASDRVYAALWDSMGVLAIDCATNTVLARIPVGREPTALACNLSGTLLYCANHSDSSVSVIDCLGDTVLATVPAGNGPRALAVSPWSGEVFCTADVAGAVTIINCTTAVATVPVGQQPSALEHNDDGSLVYCANQLSNTVSVIDARSRAVIATIPVGEGPSAFCRVSGLNRVCCANHGGRSVSVIDCSQNRVALTVITGRAPSSLCYDSITEVVCCASETDDEVLSFDPVDGGLRERLSLLPHAARLGFNPAEGKVYCACTDFHRALAIDTKTSGGAEISARLWVGARPVAVGYSPGGDKVYFANSADHTVSVVDGGSDLVLRNISTSLEIPWSFECFPAVKEMYCASSPVARDIVAIDCEVDTVESVVSTDGYVVRSVDADTIGNRLFFNTGDNLTCVVDVTADSVLTEYTECARYMLYVPQSNKVYTIDDTAVSIRECQNYQLLRQLSLSHDVKSLCYNPVNAKVYCGSLGSLFVLDGIGDSLLAVLPGVSSLILEYNCDRNVVYCSGGNEVTSAAVVDGATDVVLAWAQLGCAPQDLLYASTNGMLYAACQDSGFVGVVDGQADTLVGKCLVSEEPSVLLVVPNSPGYSTLIVARYRGENLVSMYEYGHEAVHEAGVHLLGRAVPSMVGAGQALACLATSSLFDLSGRRVMALHPGANDVSGLAPGVYFVREAQAQAQAHAVRKVVITR